MTDKQIFQKIKTRFEQDVGGLIRLIHKELSENENYVPPFWSLARILFPVAESISDLVYREKSTSKNLLNFFQNNLSRYNENYGKVGALIILIYRHSLTHQDELRTLLHEETRFYSWGIGFGHEMNHLEILNLNRGKSIPVFIQFDLIKFYNDLISALDEMIKTDFEGKVVERYEKWGLAILPKSEQPDYVEKVAINEALSLHEGWAPILPYVKPTDIEELRKNPGWPI